MVFFFTIFVFQVLESDEDEAYVDQATKEEKEETEESMESQKFLEEWFAGRQLQQEIEVSYCRLENF